ncbi:MAG: DNA-directed RNA polymerase subunit alpha [Thermoleophilia bacterium]|nr:DNA-directed RNA polymerase subunit alpha [Thermoleophilia bacterium]
MLHFQMPNITREQLATNRVRFEVEPLDRGFGHTFGNALRRVLLSSLEGAAVSSVKIEGVAHEFTTVPGVKEDITDVILNLKEIVCRLHGEIDEVQVRLVKDKPGKVVAADIDMPAELEILNPDHHIATLADGGVLEMTLTIRRGTGYVPADGNKTPDMAIGDIPIDSIFSPIKRVSYHVDSARVGQRTDYDKLILEVTTNGSLSPDEAVREAAELLVDRLSIFADPERARPSEEFAIEGLEPASAGGGMDEVLIEELELGVRSYNCLKREGIQTVGDLISKTEAELLNIPNFGKKSIDEVKEKLTARGLGLRGED